MEGNDTILDSTITDVNESGVEDQYLISATQFSILSILTLNLYPLWWFYKSWCFFRDKDKLDIQPAARTIFGIFYMHSLFQRILAFAKANGYEKNYSSTMVFILFLIGNLCSYLPDPLWLVSFLSFLFLIPPFTALNYGKEHDGNLRVIQQQSFNTRQIVLIVIGSIFWALMIFGLTLPEEL